MGKKKRKKEKSDLAGVRMNLHADKFGDRRTKRQRDRSAKERKAIEEQD